MNKISNKKVERVLIISIIITTFLVIASKNIKILGTSIYIELSSIMMGIYILYFALNIKRYKSYLKEAFLKYKVIYCSFILYICANLVKILLNFRIDTFIYYGNKIIPYIFLLVFMSYFLSENTEYIKKYFKLIMYCILCGVIFAIGLAILGYTNAAFSLDEIFHKVSFNESLNLYGEIRIYGLLSHKARFSIYCLIGMIIANLNKDFSGLKKKAFCLIFSIGAILSNSMMGIVVYFIGFIVIVFMNYEIKEVYKYIIINKKKCLIAISAIGLIGVVGVGLIATKRDISTLGHRTYIWKAGIEHVIENPNGCVIMPDELWIEAKHQNKKVYFSNAHNDYINEFIEGGILLGILYIGVNLSLLKEIIKNKKISLIVVYMSVYLIFFNFESIDIREMKNMLICLYPFIILVNKYIGVYDEKTNSCNMHI